MPNNGWYTQRELADLFQVNIQRLYVVVTTLKNAGLIHTTTNPRDARQILIHEDSVETIRRALFAPSEADDVTA
jgi:DNA-binding MarR family transcriptional regulator